MLNVSRSDCDVYCSLPLILNGTGVEFTQTCAVTKKRPNYAISYNFEIFKGMSHHLSYQAFRKCVVYRGL